MGTMLNENNLGLSDLTARFLSHEYMQITAIIFSETYDRVVAKIGFGYYNRRRNICYIL